MESDTGVSELDKVFEEADATREGRGTTLKNIWNEDVEMFFCDQHKNGEYTDDHAAVFFSYSRM